MNLKLVLAVGVNLLLVGCATVPRTPAERTALRTRAQETLDLFRERDSSIARFFDTAYGYAVFPTVAKGAIGIGGAHGQGIVYEQGKMVGYCDLSQGTIGFQLGGQGYSEIIFYQFAENLEAFKTGSFELAAQVSAVVADEGASANAAYESGVVVFTITKGGLMFEASIGGQSFDYVPAITFAEHAPTK